ncbi:phosphoribosylformylglycinamidine synthase, partial [Candidatus Woesearchaeota archaeon]|nr:phosphoribosylformylglycinamidine synthase [Candidatus Woesearchaeota archaeon]
GATFSSEAMDSGSPATAVQIGDPITQKKLSDAIVKEARDRGLYNSITDNGAGGLSCSVGEMAKECGGCYVVLHEVPVKYTGLSPWEIWISESQERMTLSVPPEKWDEFKDLMERRGVEATIIGSFNDSGYCVVNYHENIVMDLDIDFLHNGLPRIQLTTEQPPAPEPNPELPPLEDLTRTLHLMLARQNIASTEFISNQFDHEVQGGSVTKPLQGRGRVSSPAAVTRPVLESQRAVVTSQGLTPEYSEIDAYKMAATAVDSAIRAAVAAGADPQQIAILDNFCWCSSDDPMRLGQLKEAARGLSETAIDYLTPLISGKDSMYNDFIGYDADGNPVLISVPPTLLISALSVMEDATDAVTLDAKIPGDLVYVLGATDDELGGSEYFAMRGEMEQGKPYVGDSAPAVDTASNSRIYACLHQAIKEGMVASAQSLDRGGLGVALAKTAMAGKLGIKIDMSRLPGEAMRDDYRLFSESQGRLLVTVNPELQEAFEARMNGSQFAMVGKVTEEGLFMVVGRNGRVVINTDTESLLESYRGTFAEY